MQISNEKNAPKLFDEGSRISLAAKEGESQEQNGNSKGYFQLRLGITKFSIAITIYFDTTLNVTHYFISTYDCEILKAIFNSPL